MVESQDSLYSLDSQDLHTLENIPTEELLTTPEEIETVEGVLAFSPNSLSQGFHPQPEAMEYKVFEGYVLPREPEYDLSHLDKLPIVEELTTNWNFDVELHAESAGKTSWMYSAKLKKVFVKINTQLNVYTTYDKVNDQDLFVRAMIVYTSTNEAAEPVKKCPNHRDQWVLDNPEHILRCATEQSIYHGTDLGRLFRDRLAVVIPMRAIASNEPLRLQFTCQNSCSGGMNRKATSIVFTLEGIRGEILGRKIMNFKVCSCPKRDKDKDEEGVLKVMTKKRKIDQTTPSTSKKVATTVPMPMPIVKQELDTTVSMQSDLGSLPSDLQSLNSDLVDFRRAVPSCDVTLTMPNVEMAKEVLKFAYDKIAGEMFRTGDGAFEPFLNNLKKQIDDN